jgi:YspA, cpYpsA-related SLOG family
MKTIIAGSRSITDIDLLYAAIRESGFAITEVVSGRAKGVDKLGEWCADHRGIPWTGFPADWDKYGRSAGFIRNAAMADYAEAAILLWDGKSPGTEHMIALPQEKGLKVAIYLVQRGQVRRIAA